MTSSSLSLAPSRPRSMPGPRGRFLTGNLIEAWNDPLDLFVRGAREHGDYVRFRFAWMSYHLVNDAEGAHRVLVENAKGYHKSENYQGLKVMLGDGLLTSEGELWKRQRRLAQPAFHRESLTSFAEAMVSCTSDMLERWRSEEVGPFDLHREMMRLTFRVVGKTLLGADLEADAREFGEALDESLRWANEYASSIVRVPPWVPTPRNRRFRRAERTIESVVMRVVEERRRQPAPRRDLLAMLMAATDDETGQGMSDKLLRDELLTLTLAGHETTANALSFVFYLLARHPEVHARARAEVRDVLEGRAPTLADLPRMPFVRAVIEESLRLYPPAWVFERQSLEGDEIGGWSIEKGAIVGVSPFCLHRNPRYYPDPERFDPGRFLGPSDRPKLAFIPFGAGPRVCIGNAFAMMELQLIVPMMLAAFELSLVPGFELALDPSVTLRPKHGVTMTRTRAVA